MKVYVCESVEDHAAGAVYCVATSLELVVEYIHGILPHLKFDDLEHDAGTYESWGLSETGATFSRGYTFDIREFDLIDGGVSPSGEDGKGNNG